MDFAVPANHSIKLKEREKKDEYLDLAKELKKLWDMKVTIRKDYKRNWTNWKLEDEWKPSKLHLCWERTEYWEDSWGVEVTCCHSNSGERPSRKTKVKHYHRIVIIIVMNEKEKLQKWRLYCPGWPHYKTERKWKAG